MSTDNGMIVDKGDHVLKAVLVGGACVLFQIFNREGLAEVLVEPKDIPVLIELLQEALACSAQQKLEQTKELSMAEVGGITFGLGGSSSLIGSSCDSIKAGDAIHLVRTPNGTYKIEKGPA
jgi:hypothetical protein